MRIKVNLHLWSLKQPASVTRDLFSALSADERERAAHFATDTLRERFVVARGFMRHRLAANSGDDPSSLVFAYGTHGKPALESGAIFNLSHTDHLACLATLDGAPEVAAAISLGVDIEAVGLVDAGLERHALSQTEITRYKALAPDEQRSVFFRAWTRKEAIMKACGLGLSVSPRSITVDLEHAERSAVLSLPSGLPDPSQWFLSGFAPQEGTLGAVALTTPADAQVDVRAHSWCP
mgnify:CR=1 FL=1